MPKLEALFLLAPPMALDSEFHAFAFDSLLRFLRTARKVPGWSKDGGELTVNARPCPLQLKETYFGSKMKGQTSAPLLRFVGNFSYPGADGFEITNADGSPANFQAHELFAYWQSVLPDQVDVAVQTYICALAIAYPGALRCASNIWLMDGEPIEHRQCLVSTVSEAVSFLVTSGVAPAMIDPEKAIKWVFSQNGIFDGYSDTPASRALNYFTRLFVSDFRNDELSDLVWALGGIEALIVEGGRSSQGQLKEKLSALLRVETDWLHEMIKQMYEFPSKTVHGNRQLRSEFRRTEEDTEKRFREEYDSTLFAVATLVVLLQRAIEAGVPQFKFRTVLDG